VLEHDGVVGPNLTIGPGGGCIGFVSNGAHAFIGAGAVLSPEVQVGARTLVGAGAVVTRNLPADVVAYGSPARPRRTTVRGLDVPTREELAERGVPETAFGAEEGG
jgi:acetyltransferase-like isoleucine patch superfamily enzyme